MTNKLSLFNNGNDFVISGLGGISQILNQNAGNFFFENADVLWRLS